MTFAKAPPPPRAFSGSDLYKMLDAVQKITETQLGALMDPYTAEELTLLFVPYEHRKPLKHVYQIESTSEAKGDIFVDLVGVLPHDVTRNLIADDRNTLVARSAVMRLHFHRDWMPEGFVTPEPLFGTRATPISNLQDCPERLRHRFMMQSELLLRTIAEWSLVRYCLEKLQNSVRTPQQVRYVWPAIQTLVKVAGLEKMDLTQPSVRAGMNARPDPKCAPYLRVTNDVVANSVLLGVNDTYRDRFKRGDIGIVHAVFAVGDDESIVVNA